MAAGEEGPKKSSRLVNFLIEGLTSKVVLISTCTMLAVLLLFQTSSYSNIDKGLVMLRKAHLFMQEQNMTATDIGEDRDYMDLKMIYAWPSDQDFPGAIPSVELVRALRVLGFRLFLRL